MLVYVCVCVCVCLCVRESVKVTLYFSHPGSSLILTRHVMSCDHVILAAVMVSPELHKRCLAQISACMAGALPQSKHLLYSFNCITVGGFLTLPQIISSLDQAKKYFFNKINLDPFKRFIC